MVDGLGQAGDNTLPRAQGLQVHWVGCRVEAQVHRLHPGEQVRVALHHRRLRHRSSGGPGADDLLRRHNATTLASMKDDDITPPPSS